MPATIASPTATLQPQQRPTSPSGAAASHGQGNEFTMPKAESADVNVLLRGLLHELRNPLSSILTAANLVEDSARAHSDVDEETSMLLAVIRKESLRLNYILTEFASYIKLPPPSPDVFDLTELTRETVAQRRQGGDLTEGITIDDDLPEQCFVLADRTQIGMVLEQLLKNAGEAMAQDGTLYLHCYEEDAMVQLCLGDSGSGFDRESRERAFQPFYSTKLHKTGLGLSVSRTIMEAAGGHIWISDSNSELFPDEVKTRICIELPVANT